MLDFLGYFSTEALPDRRAKREVAPPAGRADQPDWRLSRAESDAVYLAGSGPGAAREDRRETPLFVSLIMPPYL